MASLLQRAHVANPGFQNIPVMCVSNKIEITTYDVSLLSDLLNASSTDPEERNALVEEIRNACINVGFFYGACSAARN